MDGLTLCKKIKVEMGINVPVIIFSSMINEQMAIKCREVGADAFITKPKSAELVEIIDRHFMSSAQ
jgi:two-component system chemotaxis response regulator CheV